MIVRAATALSHRGERDKPRHFRLDAARASRKARCSRRVKAQSSLPSEDAAVVLLFSLVASGQIRLRRIDGWRKIASVLSQHTAVAA
jgi:hypothetical protein